MLNSGEVKDETRDSKTTDGFSQEVNNEAKQQEGAKDLHDSNRFYGSNTVTDDDRCWCKEELQQLLDRVYPPLVVRELLILQTGIPGKYLNYFICELVKCLVFGCKIFRNAIFSPDYFINKVESGIR